MLNLNDLDTNTPGGVYLCQVSETLSCGACCGLYNVENASREVLADMLAWRTQTFADMPRTLDGILEFRAAVENREPQDRPYPDFHHCPYIGLVGEGLSRVGCLLHPMADGNRGVDFRGISYYGGMACRTYFCPSCRRVNPVYKEIIREAAQNWYEYGLMTTEADLLAAFFGAVEEKAGRLLTKTDIKENPARLEAVRDFLNLRAKWPFRSDLSKPGNYFFEDGLYPRCPVDYQQVGTGSSRYDLIFRELESVFDSADALCRAEAMISDLIERTA